MKEPLPNNLVDKLILPYVNSKLLIVASVVQNYGLTLTSALNSDKNKATEGAGENSLHMYGYSTGATYDVMLRSLCSLHNPINSISFYRINFDFYKHTS